MFKLAIWLVFIFSVSFAYRVKRDANVNLERSVEEKNEETDALKKVNNGTTEIMNSLYKKMEDANAEMYIRSALYQNPDAGKVNNDHTEIFNSVEPRKKDAQLSSTKLNSSVLEDVYVYVYYICTSKLMVLKDYLDDLEMEYADLYEKVNIGLTEIINSVEQKMSEVSFILVNLGFGNMDNELGELRDDLKALKKVWDEEVPVSHLGPTVENEELTELKGTVDSKYDEADALKKNIGSLDIKQTKLSEEQSGYLGLPVDGPYKPEHYRY